MVQTMNENRLIDIETRIAYQENTIQQLNDVVTKQQKQISHLEELVETLIERYQSLQSSQIDVGNLDEKPPHY